MTGYFLGSLALTLALELPFAWIWGLRGRDLTLAVLVNVLTNPAAALLHLLIPSGAALLLLECAVVLAEWRLYRSCGEGVQRPLLLSLGANVFSFCTGYLLLGL